MVAVDGDGGSGEPMTAAVVPAVPGVGAEFPLWCSPNRLYLGDLGVTSGLFLFLFLSSATGILPLTLTLSLLEAEEYRVLTP